MGKISAYRGNLHGLHGSFGSSRVMGQTGFVDFLNQLTKEFAGRDRVSETIRQILDVIKRKRN
jgi:hypothetical protein